MFQLVFIYILFMIALAFRKHANRCNNECIKKTNNLENNIPIKEKCPLYFQNNTFSNKNTQTEFDDLPIVEIDRDFIHYIVM